MLDTFESLSLGATTAIVATISLLVVYLVLLIVRFRFIWLIIVVVPVILSYVIYWLPVWVNTTAHSAEYEAFEPVLLGIWGGAGVVLSAIVVLFGRKLMGRRAHHV